MHSAAVPPPAAVRLLRLLVPGKGRLRCQPDALASNAPLTPQTAGPAAQSVVSACAPAFSVPLIIYGAAVPSELWVARLCLALLHCRIVALWHCHISAVATRCPQPIVLGSLACNCKIARPPTCLLAATACLYCLYCLYCLWLCANSKVANRRSLGSDISNERLRGECLQIATPHVCSRPSQQGAGRGALFGLRLRSRPTQLPPCLPCARGMPRQGDLQQCCGYCCCRAPPTNLVVPRRPELPLAPFGLVSS
jgi:hypothetical protein